MYLFFFVPFFIDGAKAKRNSLTDEVPSAQLSEMIFIYTDHVLTYFVNSHVWAFVDALFLHPFSLMRTSIQYIFFKKTICS